MLSYKNKIVFKKIFTALLVGFSLFSESVFAASLFFSGDNDGTDSYVFTMDKSALSSTYIDLVFALTTSQLRYDIALAKFIFNRTLDMGGNQILNARIQNLGSAPTCDTNSKGLLYHNTANTYSYVCNGTDFVQVDNTAGGSGDVVGPADSADDQVALFSGTTGKIIKRSTSFTGLAKLVAGVLSAAAAGTDYVAPNASITGSTKTKISYDSKGLVTAGADATLASSDFANQGTTITVLHGNVAGNPSWGSITEADLSFSDNTTGNFSISAHGFVPKGTNLGKFLKDDGTWTTVSAGAGGSNTQVQYNNNAALGGIANATTDGTTLTMASPKIITSLNDTNANELFKFTATANAINELTLANAEAGGNPTISATGGDTDIGITLATKGVGNITLTVEMVEMAEMVVHGYGRIFEE